MPKVIPIPDQMYEKILQASRNLNYSLLEEMYDPTKLKLLGVEDLSILTNPNDILVILHLIAGLTGKNINNMEYIETVVSTKRKKKSDAIVLPKEDLPSKAMETKPVTKIKTKTLDKKKTIVKKNKFF